jgi:glycosyltransferase involved in cell wall biosynthesis
MKVLHIIPSIGPLRGGPSVAALAMCRALTDEGVACDLVCTNDNGAGVLDVPVGEWTMHEEVRTWFFRRMSPRWRPVREFQIGEGFSPWLARHARDYDLLHVHALFSHLPTVAMAFARRHGIPYVLRPLGILESYSLGRSPWKKRAFLALFDSANIRGASAVHLTSRREENVSRIPGHASRWVIPLGVRIPDGPAAAGRGNPPRIVFLSRWHAKKRIEMLLEALSMLGDLDWTLVLAGAGEPGLTDRIHSLVRQYGLGNRVSFPGFLTGDAKAQLLAGADLFVLPSASENFGIAAAEALAAGLPVIVSRHVALCDEIESAQAGWICGDDAAALARTLRTALADPDERRRRGQIAARLARTAFSWKSCAEKLASSYRELLHPRQNV